MDARTQNVVAAARETGAGWTLLTAPDSVAYGTRHVVGIETGPSPFDGGPTAALIGPEGQISIACNELETASANASDATAVYSYESLGFSDLRPLPEKHLETIRAMISESGVTGIVAIEAGSCPAAITSQLNELGGTTWIDQPLTRYRAVKTDTEIAMLTACAELTAAGQAAFPNAVVEGETELSAWREIRQSMESAVGTRIPVAGDFVSGRDRTAAIGGPPTNRRFESGDPIISDLAPRHNGYWGDSCTTACLRKSSEKLDEMYAVTYRAYELVRETLRPGISAAEFDAPIRKLIHDAGYANTIHMGHGIGTSVHEWPRLVPGENAKLLPGMVLMVEPGTYHPEIGGVRLEQMFLLTENGHKVLSPFEIESRMPIIE